VNEVGTYPWSWEEEVARKVLLKALRPSQTEWRAEKRIQHKIRRFFRQEERAKNNYFTQLEIENLRLLRGAEKAKERQQELNALRLLFPHREDRRNLENGETTDPSEDDGEEMDHAPDTARTRPRTTVYRVKRKERTDNQVIESGTGDEDTNSERENTSLEKDKENTEREGEENKQKEEEVDLDDTLLDVEGIEEEEEEQEQEDEIEI